MTTPTGRTQRAYIEGFIEDHPKWNAKTLSLHLSRNESYIQQFLKKKSPRELHPNDFDKIKALETAEPESAESTSVVEVPVQTFRAGMGGGGVVSDERPAYFFPIRREYINQLRLSEADLFMIEVEGDSMSPTLESGDLILINKADRNPARGGVFTIFDSDTLVVKRIENIPATDPPMHRLISDNKNHSAYDVLAESTFIAGRVVWFARRM